MSTDKYAQFISRQQRQLSVSGTNNPVGTLEEALGSMDNIKKASKKGYEDSRKGQPPLSPKQKKIAAQAGDPEEIDAEDFKKLRAMKKEEAEIEEAKARSDLYIGSVDRDDPDYEKKVGELKSKANKGGTRIRGRLGKDNPNASLYRRGGELHRMTSQDIKPEHAKRVDVYSKKYKKEEVEVISEEEIAYLEEMVGKGKLPDIAQHHYNAMKHHEKMAKHHDGMAAASEHVGDSQGADYHYDMIMQHANDAEHHQVRYDMAHTLGAKLKARREAAAATSKLKDANEKLAKVRDAKRYGY